MTTEKAQDSAEPMRAASALSAGLGVANCKHCGSEDYTIQLLHVGFRQRILVVECRECRSDLIPVVLDYFMPEAECYSKWREAWNAANVTPNVVLTGAARHGQQTKPQEVEK